MLRLEAFTKCLSERLANDANGTMNPFLFSVLLGVKN